MEKRRIEKNGYQFRLSTKETNRFNLNRIIAHNHRRAKNHKSNIHIDRIGWDYNPNNFKNKKDFIKKCDELYSKELENYNSIQTRNDRIKDSFFENTNYNNKELFKEVCLTIDCSKYDWENNQEDRDRIVEEYRKHMRVFMDKYTQYSTKSTRLVDMVVHFDESTPHCHFVFSTYTTKKNKKGQEYIMPCGTSMKNDQIIKFKESFDQYMVEQGFKEHSKESKRQYFENINDLDYYNKQRDIRINEMTKECVDTINSFQNELKREVLNNKDLMLKKIFEGSIIEQICKDNDLDIEYPNSWNKLFKEVKVGGRTYTFDDNFYFNVEPTINVIMDCVRVKQLNDDRVFSSIDNYEEWIHNVIVDNKQELKDIQRNIKYSREELGSLNEIIDKKKEIVKNNDLIFDIVGQEIKQDVKAILNKEKAYQELEEENQRLEGFIYQQQIEKEELEEELEQEREEKSKLQRALKKAWSVIDKLGQVFNFNTNKYNSLTEIEQELDSRLSPSKSNDYDYDM